MPNIIGRIICALGPILFQYCDLPSVFYPGTNLYLVSRWSVTRKNPTHNLPVPRATVHVSSSILGKFIPSDVSSIRIRFESGPQIENASEIHTYKVADEKLKTRRKKGGHNSYGWSGVRRNNGVQKSRELRKQRSRVRREDISFAPIACVPSNRNNDAAGNQCQPVSHEYVISHNIEFHRVHHFQHTIIPLPIASTRTGPEFEVQHNGGDCTIIELNDVSTVFPVYNNQNVINESPRGTPISEDSSPPFL